MFNVHLYNSNSKQNALAVNKGERNPWRNNCGKTEGLFACCSEILHGERNGQKSTEGPRSEAYLSAPEAPWIQMFIFLLLSLNLYREAAI